MKDKVEWSLHLTRSGAPDTQAAQPAKLNNEQKKVLAGLLANEYGEIVVPPSLAQAIEPSPPGSPSQQCFLTAEVHIKAGKKNTGPA